MTKNIFPFIVLAIGSASQAQDLNPINIFNPQVGQSVFLETTTPDSAYYYSVTLSVVRRNGDTGFVRSGKTSNESSIYTSEGVTVAPMVLSTGRVDTNGIYANEMHFPEQYTSINPGEREYGFVTGYEVKGFHFDTLLVSCYYMSYLDVGDMCDFVTPSGIMVQSVNHNCFCVHPGPFYREPSDAVLQIAGGQILPVVLPTQRPSNQNFSGNYNLMGKVLSTPKYRNQISVRKENIRLP